VSRDCDIGICLGRSAPESVRTSGAVSEVFVCEWKMRLSTWLTWSGPLGPAAPVVPLALRPLP